MTIKTLFCKCNRKSNSSTTITCITSKSPLFKVTMGNLS
nr:MAG TPA: hypothetical protein [Caudoviricetes sp.]